jgi:hypothetical protein
MFHTVSATPPYFKAGAELPWGIQMRATLHMVHHAAHVQSSPIT